MTYQPYGPEWEKEMMKHSKIMLKLMFNVSGDGILKKEQINRIRIKLINAKNGQQ